MTADIVDTLTATLIELDRSGMVDYVKYGTEARDEIIRLRKRVDQLVGEVNRCKADAYEARDKVSRLREALRGLDEEDDEDSDE